MKTNTTIKKELRKRILAERIAIDPNAAKHASDTISNTLIAEYDNRVICSYISFRGEVDLTRFHEYTLASGKTLLLPYVGDTMLFCEVKSLSDLVKSKMGILEPNPETCRIWTYEEIWANDPLVLTPGVAFTLEGQRMGYGGGYYDRFFQTHTLSAAQDPQSLTQSRTLSPAQDAQSPAQDTKTSNCAQSHRGCNPQNAQNCPGTSVGICFDVQVVPELPTEEHDIPVDRILVGKTSS